MSGAAPVPAGYVERQQGSVRIVALVASAERVARAVAEHGTLYAYAAAHPDARVMHGRAPAYAAPLPDDGPRVVVRHSRHGGWLAPLTGDRFLCPTRAPRELHAALRLARAGVPTPEIVAYALYPAAPLLCRADVASREVRAARDLGDVLADPASASDDEAWLPPVGALLLALSAAGAHHPDLNVKNVLLAPAPAGPPVAHVLDVDRVRFGKPSDPAVAAANLARLVRSARKRRDAGLAHATDAQLDRLARAAMGPSTAPAAA